MKKIVKSLSEKQTKKIIATLKSRFEKHMHRHKNIVWTTIEKKLVANPQKIWTLNEMEKTGGEPDVISYNTKTDEYTFCDCSPESPSDRRSLCYDRDALHSRKEHKPKNTALDMAENMGIQLLTEADYQAIQKIEPFDTKTSSWLATPTEVRKLGGAVFGDRRYDRVFIYHNGAESYYAARGFRGMLKV